MPGGVTGRGGDRGETGGLPGEGGVLTPAVGIRTCHNAVSYRKMKTIPSFFLSFFE